jgi:hypothetical protein
MWQDLSRSAPPEDVVRRLERVSTGTRSLTLDPIEVEIGHLNMPGLVVDN